MKCRWEPCDRNAVTRGLCKPHYSFAYRRGDPRLLPSKRFTGGTLREKFDSVGWDQGDNGCFIWRGRRFRLGYGLIYWQGQNLSAHRVAYELLVGEITDGLHVLHSCDTRDCVNPDHLRLGTHSDNMRDKVTRGRVADMGGEKNPAAKMTWPLVHDLRQRWNEGHWTNFREAGTHYGISETMARDIVWGRSWREPDVDD